MHENKKEYPIEKMAELLGVQRSGYYRWINRKISNKEKEDEDLKNEILKIQKENYYSYGVLRVTKCLSKCGKQINHKRVARIMKKNDLNFRKKKKFKITTDSSHNLEYSENLLNRDFDVKEIDKVWASDITYLWTNEGWVYVCVIIDLCSKRIVGWSLSARIDTTLLLNAFWMAWYFRNPKDRLLFHSDRGVQYCSKRFRNVLKSFGIVQSMSRKGNCWDNACSESFFKTLKTEWFYDVLLRSRKEAKEKLFEYIEVFYNRKRLHSSLDYDSPVEYELKLAA
jgi:putative transposase